MTASADAAREYLAGLRPDALRLASGIIANPYLTQWLIEEAQAGHVADPLQSMIERVADIARRQAQEIDRETGVSPDEDAS